MRGRAPLLNPRVRRAPHSESPARPLTPALSRRGRGGLSRRPRQNPRRLVPRGFCWSLADPRGCAGREWRRSLTPRVDVDVEMSRQRRWAATSSRARFSMTCPSGGLAGLPGLCPATNGPPPPRPATVVADGHRHSARPHDASRQPPWSGGARRRIRAFETAGISGRGYPRQWEQGAGTPLLPGEGSPRLLRLASRKEPIPRGRHKSVIAALHSPALRARP
jgi:hypothetical protein